VCVKHCTAQSEHYLRTQEVLNISASEALLIFSFAFCLLLCHACDRTWTTNIRVFDSKLSSKE